MDVGHCQLHHVGCALTSNSAAHIKPVDLLLSPYPQGDLIIETLIHIPQMREALRS